jgi:Fibrobacter succinogenes major domain (Fib_succ_major).
MGFALIIANSCKKLENSITVADIDGNVYKTVTIGTQVWIAENLKNTKYNDGTAIALVTDGTTWTELTTPSYCWYNNNADTYKDTYGALYNWYTVDAISNGGKNICPIGWHIPSDVDWTTLIDYLSNNGYGYQGSGSDIGKSIAATSGWTTYSTAGTVGNDQASNNSSGFTAVPCGDRSPYTGEFGGASDGTCWWSSTEISKAIAGGQYLNHGDSGVGRFTSHLQNGFSVRCVKD